MDIFQNKKELQLDEIIHKSGFSFGIAATTLMQLEFKGAILVKPGKTYLLR